MVLTNPIWVVKTRLCAWMPQVEAPHYRSLIGGVVHIARHEGLAGLYRGLLPGLVGVAHVAVQFMAYEELKRQVLHRRAGSRHGGLSSDPHLVACRRRRAAVFVRPSPALCR